MAQAVTGFRVEETVEATVIRCGCGDPEAHSGAVCPRPRAVEDLGVISRHVWEPARRLVRRIRRQAAH